MAKTYINENYLNENVAKKECNDEDFFIHYELKYDEDEKESTDELQGCQFFQKPEAEEQEEQAE